MKIPRSLIDAYLGYFEEEFAAAHNNYVAEQRELNAETVESQSSWIERNCAIPLIHGHSPIRRLAIYLEWEGIIGSTSTIFIIATEDFS